MSRRNRKANPARFGSELVAAADEEIVDSFYDIDRDSADYLAGVAAVRAGEERDITRSLDWLAGYDEGKQ